MDCFLRFRLSKNENGYKSIKVSEPKVNKLYRSIVMDFNQYLMSVFLFALNATASIKFVMTTK